MFPLKYAARAHPVSPGSALAPIQWSLTRRRTARMSARSGTATDLARVGGALADGVAVAPGRLPPVARPQATRPGTAASVPNPTPASNPRRLTAATPSRPRVRINLGLVRGVRVVAAG